jgi:hypothetical protein
MVLLNKSGWEIAGGLASAVVVGGAALWLLLRNRPTAEEVEQARRLQLVRYGRLVDGMLLDLIEMNGEPDRPLRLLLFSYRIGGVDYECSQDITAMQETVDPAQVRVGLPCTVRYQPGNPQNSIVVAEGWTGLRANLPNYPTPEAPHPVEARPLRSRG